ncbi:hypothetical protein KP509_34G059200 [Ceratopteris richardii]|uniref:Steroid 5-alpha-reductase DET2 n=1 Tax=Ceratopteris richardii TaxID=49495 RepID=A0A8T2QKU7_CERRI|nr:hypothetical protein KP509_34G059200 [Ceratopteris richardii]
MLSKIPPLLTVNNALMDEQLLFESALLLGMAVAPVIWWTGRKDAAPYGRHHTNSGAGSRAVKAENMIAWNLLTLPTRITWFLMECPCLFFMVPIFCMGRYANLKPPRILAALFLLHYVHRALVYPLRMRPSPKRNFPVIILISGVCFNIYNVYIQARSLSNFRSYPPTWLSSPQFVVGCMIFLFGMVTNVWADSILISLRKSSKGDAHSPASTSPTESSSKMYKIPMGGLFDLVTCPNYLGEIIEWLGWATATWSFAGLVFFVLTVCNLLPRALAHHQWYLINFPTIYPLKRKAIIPFIL